MSLTETGMNLRAAQPGLPLVVAQRTVLLGLETVRARFGCDAESVFAMVESGRLRWVFDVSLEHQIAQRELRFWTGEIVAPENVARQTVEQVIAAIVGRGATVRRGEIERQWVVSAQHVGRLVKAGELTLASMSQITRASLENFLERRLCQ